MIILRITSGLGNQMFQYAFYTLLKKQYKDTEILCDTRWFNCNFEGRKYELETIFSGVEGSLFEIKKSSFLQTVKLSGKVPNAFTGALGEGFEKFRRYPNRLLKNNLLKSREPYILDQHEGNLSDDITSILSSTHGEMDALSDDKCNNVSGGANAIGLDTPFYKAVMNLDTSKDYFICGFFIEEKYYSQVIDEVRKHFVFPEITEDHNIRYAEDIKNSNSVSIHVRRGDYLSDIYKDKFMTLGREYYKGAVCYIDKNACTPVCSDTGTQDCDENENKNVSLANDEFKYFIFSDDADFVKKEFDWLDNKVIVTGNSGDLSYRDMQLMSLCRHNIIANSTFSQWGALLNRNDNHITVYPKVYMKDHDNEIKALPGWIRL